MDAILKAKQAVGFQAAALVEDGMLVGLGTGSTATCFIDSLIERCNEGLSIQAVATSQRSHDQALNGGIAIVDINSITRLDICVDGADEIDPKKRMIKGGGGALLKEKIVASMSSEMLVLVDDSKCVEKLGTFPLPIEIIPYAFKATLNRLESLGYKGVVRTSKGDRKYVTESGHFIYDVKLSPQHPEPVLIHQEIINIPGVVETGLFLNLAGRVLVGKSDGSVELIL